MGQTQATKRLETIKENVDEITEKLKYEELTVDDRNRSHYILLDYIKELNLILSKSLRPSRIRKVEKLIIAALEELATLEGKFKNIEPRLRAKSMQALHDIEKNTKSISDNLRSQNRETEKEVISGYKKRLSLIEDVDHEVGVTKNKVLEVVCNVENRLNELEVEDQLKSLEQKHNQGKLDLSRFVGVTDSKCYHKHKQHLLELKKEIDLILDVTPAVSERKKYLQFNIENNIVALDSRVKENEKNIKSKIVETEVFKATSPVFSYHDNNLSEFVRSYEVFEKHFTANCGLEQLQEIFNQLNNVKIKMDQKLQVLENQIKVEEANPFVELIEKEVKADVPVPAPRGVNALKEIEYKVEYLRQLSKNSNDNQTETTVKKLRGYRNKLHHLSLREGEHQSIDNISKTIDSILIDLENNRRRDTGDILIDVMSVNDNVTDLGKSIQVATSFDDYDFIQSQLLDNLNYLTNLEIPLARSNVCQLRDYTVIQIENHLSNLAKIMIRNKNEVTQARNEQMLSF